MDKQFFLPKRKKLHPYIARTIKPTMTATCYHHSHPVITVFCHMGINLTASSIFKGLFLIFVYVDLYSQVQYLILFYEITFGMTHAILENFAVPS